MKQSKEWYEEAAQQENEWVRAVVLKPNHAAQGHALKIATRASDMAGRALGKFHPSYAEALQNIGVYFSALGNDPDKATDYFDKARKVVGPYHPVLSRSFYFLSQHHLESGNLESAETFLNEVLGIFRRAGYPYDPRVADVLTMLARIKSAGGKTQEASIYLEEVSAIQEVTLQRGKSKRGQTDNEGQAKQKKGKAAQ